MIDRVLDGRDSAENALIVCDFLLRVKWDVEVDLQGHVSFLLQHNLERYSELTLIRTRLSLRSTSVMASLLERDMLLG